MSSRRLSATKNRRYWDGIADEYQSLHGRRLTAARPAWGVWRIPESRLEVLGDPRGRDLLELGCGAAQWSIALARAGGRPVGLDNSGHQLEHARRLVRRARVRVPLVHASAEDVPLADATFDVVFCDHGAMSFADPRRTVPECARLLRPGGLLAFCHESPFSRVCTSEGRGRQVASLQRDYFGTGRHDSGVHVEYHPGYGEWIGMFRESGLSIEALIELRPAPNAATSYDGWSREWARRWPAENLWKVRKEAP
ncbi:MAG TPA: class I SAM-dependent methyltransferase [Gemmatimonadota bacterium]|nr:class I SAM-dependent methyltransferase [Gemmatimonadota bacterium]